jgi:xanthine dehydrogenase small subunit
MRTEIRFLLNGKPQRISGVDGDMTLLGWLRQHPKLRGTKEGCAEGDCGACTIAIARPDASGRLVYRPINACILFLAMVDGAAVRTVEGLAEADGGLHPVQHAMVTANASQCGFCTPGFVMSLYAAWKNNRGLEAHAIDDTLAGNLCRCTGYRSIVVAATQLYQKQVAGCGEKFNGNDDEAAALNDLMDDLDLVVDNGAVCFYAPASAESFVRLYSENPHAVIVGGATDVGLWVTKQHRNLGTMIWTGRVAGFDHIDVDGDMLRVGPAVTHQTFLAAIIDDLPECAELLRRFAALQVRSSGTVCGNIANASPIGDLPPVFIALDGKVELTQGTRKRCLDLEAFFIDYGRQDRIEGEFVSAILLPRGPTPYLRCYKISKRFDQDISAVMLAANLEVKDGVIDAARLAFGGMAGIPKRATTAEAALIGQPLDFGSFERAAAALVNDFTPLSDMRGSAEYRMITAQNLIVKYGLELLGGKNMRITGPGLAMLMEGL